MRRALAVSIVLTAVNLAAGAAVAQQAPTNASGLRYLSWPGKPAVAARATPTPAVIQAETPAPTVTAANRTLPGAIPLARLSPAPSVAPSVTTPRSNGLTPASAWMPQRAPMQAEPAQTPPVEAAPAETPPAQAQAQAQATRVAPSPYVPEPQSSAPQPQPEPQMQAAQAEPQPEPQPAQAAVADPMAPRRDAPIYRLQRPQAGAPLDAAAVAASGQAALTPTAGDNSARYYSVHRQAGRHPDAIPAPQQTYLDALPVQMAQTPQSSDLAQPDGPPALIRNANGSLRAVPQTEADNLP